MSAATRQAKLGKARPDMRGDGNPMRRPDVAAKVGASSRGVPKSEAQRARISATLTGRYRGSAHPNWKGTNAGYGAVHYRADLVLPRQCLHCGRTDDLDCALRKDAPSDSIRISDWGWRYSVAEPPESVYIRLCPSCHSKYDARP